MLKIRQTENDDCLAVAVSCITEIDRSQLPECKPTIVPRDIYGVWNDWAMQYGYSIEVGREDPGGLCVAGVIVPGPHPDRWGNRYGEMPMVHAVVWDNGLVWDPEGYTEGLYDEILYYIKVEKV